MLMKYVLCAFAPLALAGCPVLGGGGGGVADADITRGESGAAAGRGALDRLVDQATRDRFPPPPPLSTLCQLYQGQTTFGAAKKLLAQPDKKAGYPGAEPQSESQDATMAGLSYRFSGPMQANNAGAGGAATPEPRSVSIILRFTWSDGSPGGGCLLTGLGCSPEDLLKGYVLKDMSITGQPYPDCWPHEEE